MKFARLGVSLVLGLCVLLSALWAVAAVEIAGPVEPFLRHGLVLAFGAIALLSLLGLFVRRGRSPVLGIYALAFLGVLVWWFNLTPRNDRDWQPDVAVLPWASISGDEVTMHNIRNFSYRSEFDYTPAYYDKKYNLRDLQGVDLVTSYWMGPKVAHAFLSFDFGGNNHLAISIETRKEKGEAYSTLNGFFRQYELYYVVADERDVIRSRTNYRENPPEDVYVYRLKGEGESARRVLLEYLRKANSLKDEPAFYNSLTSNCTTSMWVNAGVAAGRVPLNWKILVSGYLPEYMYEQGRLETGGMSFADLQRHVHVNARAKKSGEGPEFSRLIRNREPKEIIEEAGQAARQP